ncbi:cell death abnormality protein 1-like isoform X2 [Mercenaria mercenaria]|uniref:cell death abnormality protein 1-like isoform X2 n=1 Tax=Mercenaria mercenaria TaxID=6596 RepID=UPI00234F1B9C|nr:cell death abnormality protein 1-like isoform X2 [Mercenaria mercenaria]
MVDQDIVFVLCIQLWIITADGVNVALNKPAELSKQYQWSDGDDTAERAVDGNINQDLNRNSCFHTDISPTNWWYVDLQRIYRITKIKVYNRLDCCSERSRNLTVLLGNSLDNMTQMVYWPDPIGAIKCLSMPVNTKGRYVKLVQEANDYFHLCEVQVFAPADDNECDARGGCEARGGCDANADCINTKSGNSCQCKTGYHGDGKQCSECGKGVYGVNCEGKCGQCTDDECHPETGECLRGCLAGYTGPLCKDNCSDGYFGANCTIQCGHCLLGKPCDKFTGQCVEGCDKDFVGGDCMTGIPEFVLPTVICVTLFLTVVVIFLVYMKRRPPTNETEPNEQKQHPLQTLSDLVTEQGQGQPKHQNIENNKEEHDCDIPVIVYESLNMYVNDNLAEDMYQELEPYKTEGLHGRHSAVL